VYLDIHEATAYAKIRGRYPIQVSINQQHADGGGHGFRIAGPKFTLSGARLLRRVKLDAHDAAEIRRYLDLVDPPAAATPWAVERELHAIAKALGPDVLRRRENGDDSLDPAAEVAALRGMVAGYRRALDEALTSAGGSCRP